MKMVDFFCPVCKQTKQVSDLDYHSYRRKTCSYKCANVHIRTDFPPIEDSFGNWLAGITDGEGSFQISIVPRKRKTFTQHVPDTILCFSITLRTDDEQTLNMIKKTLDCGKIWRRKASRRDGAKRNPSSCLYIAGTYFCKHVCDIFDKYPLRAKKARDFQIWKEAVYEKLANGNSNWELLKNLAQKIRETRVYREL